MRLFSSSHSFFKSIHLINLPEKQVNIGNICKEICNCKNLKQLSLTSSSLIDDDISPIFSSCTGLYILNLRECSKLTDKSIKEISHLHELQALVLR